MKSMLTSSMLVVLLALSLAGCAKKGKPASESQFKQISDYFQSKSLDRSFGPEQKIEYLRAQLGPEHQRDGDKLRWFTAPEHCNFYEINPKGMSSWGTAQKERCEQFAPH